MFDLIGLDFETYGAVSLPDHGLDNYVHGLGFRPLIACTVQRVMNGAVHVSAFDFTSNEFAAEELDKQLENKVIVAHNAGFERAVLDRIGIPLPSERFIDSAALARAYGAAGKLEAAAPQLLGVGKLDSGWPLIKLFSMPGKYQAENGDLFFDRVIVEDHPDDWAEFIRYCMVDAELSLALAEMLLPLVGGGNELVNSQVTMDMNNTGWPVDLQLVHNMNLRYMANVANAEAVFRQECDAHDLNLSSSLQLKSWCEARGVKSSSFDEMHVAKLLAAVSKRMLHVSMTEEKYQQLLQVKRMLETKQLMGGSSLKKLPVLINSTSSDGRLRDSYLHCGAGQSWRTSGRGVQMQNLPRLGGKGDDMDELWIEDTEWDNHQLSANLRQVFAPENPDGRLIVGDFSSVESRGLAWQAGEQWKIAAYLAGADIYKELASKKFGVETQYVDKAQRTFGKVGELSCGYGAGPGAVKDFAEKMGVILSDVEAADLVKGWRDTCPNTTDYWFRLHTALLGAVTQRQKKVVLLPHGCVSITPVQAPQSLRDQVGSQHLQSLRIAMYLDNGEQVLVRMVHGAHLVGKSIHYWKPSDRKGGDLWINEGLNPKTKRRQPFTIYGGKLAGILTQSMCREVFFDSLRDVAKWVDRVQNVRLIGQFHDEIVLEWWPDPMGLTLEAAKRALEMSMSETRLPGFPLAAEIKDDHRYTK